MLVPIAAFPEDGVVFSLEHIPPTDRPWILHHQPLLLGGSFVPRDSTFLLKKKMQELQTVFYYTFFSPSSHSSSKTLALIHENAGNGGRKRDKHTLRCAFGPQRVYS